MISIYIWGTGDWCNLLMNILPQNCLIKAYVETEPKRNVFNGRKLLSAEEYKNEKEKYDLTIVAVRKNGEIRKFFIENNYDSNVFFIISINNQKAKLQDISGQVNIDLANLFDEKYIQLLDIMKLQKQHILDKKLMQYTMFESNWAEVSNLICLPFSISNSLKKEEFLENNFLFCRTNFRINSFDTVRLLVLWMNLEETLNCAKGDIAELGVFEGATAAILAKYGEKYNRELFLFDTFAGFDSRDLLGLDKNHKEDFTINSIQDVKKQIGHDEICHYKKGYFPDTLDEECDRQYAFVHIDCDLYNPIKFGLQYFSKHLSENGRIFVHDYRSGFWNGATKAVDEFIKEYRWEKILIPDMSGTVVLMRRGNS